ncbi:MAG: mRNA surveillance protein pelota [Nanoarchaeota archaeon]|nr:mRNA surveillance protein pelota [Nanoarchaeota archaeon]MBU4123899.1 mRNA surveillance protein pelota [Nanoarchaeota archaeon]
MKASFDPKHDIGRLTPESLDDLFILKDIITPGSLVKAKTQRSIQVKRGDDIEKVGKKTVLLTVIAEKIELTDKLRISGRIAEGPEDIIRSSHTIAIEPGMYFEVQRTWKSWELNKIKLAEKKQEPVFICILDDREADIYIVGERTEHKMHISGGVGKAIDQKPQEYFGKIVSELKKAEMKIIVAGPGFAREDIIKSIKDSDLKKKITTDGLSHTGEVGLQELINRGTIEKIINDSRLSEETEIVERLLTEIMKEGKAIYGINETHDALKQGALETLLISDMKVREFEEIMDFAEKKSTKVMIISSKHQSGEKLLGLGGIAGLLRYKI